MPLERLRKDPRCQEPRGTRFGFKNMPHHLDSTVFHRLVETGFVGNSRHLRKGSV